MNIEITIDELVLHGLLPSERYQISEALQAELTRLFAEGSQSQIWAGRRDVPYLDAGSFPVPLRAKPETIGAQVAAAIHREITK